MSGSFNDREIGGGKSTYINKVGLWRGGCAMG
jgi:hypothetical protein